MSVSFLTGDCRDVLDTLPEKHFQTCVTSPPYFGLRDYGHPSQMGLEPTPDEFEAALVEVFRKVRRVLRDDGTVWLNIGDSYGRGARVDNVNDNKRGASANTGHVSLTAAQAYGQGARVHLKPKDLIGIPWRVAFALQADGWTLRQEIIWHKPNPMPESVTDRCTKAHESVFLLSKGPRYFFDAAAIAEPAVYGTWPNVSEKHIAGVRSAIGGGAAAGAKENAETRNRRSVWTIATEPFREAHYAVMPPKLAQDCIKAGSKPGDHVLDPFGGAGTTALCADRLQRHATLIELNPVNVAMSRNRIVGDAPLFVEAAE